MTTLTTRDVAFSLFGAYRLARFDATGVNYIDRSPEGALKSFWAALLVLPAYAGILMLQQWDLLAAASPPRLVIVEAIAYVVSWTAYPAIMHTVAGVLDRSKRYPDFVAVYNWSSVVQMAVYLPALLLAETGLLPDAAGDTLVFAVSVAVLCYQWFVVRVALDVNGFMAASLVLLDLFLSAVISDYADGLLM